jgi:protein TonB
MKLDDWTEQANPADAARRQRLTIGYLVGAGTVALAMSFLTYSAHGRVFEQEDTIDVSLAKAPVFDELEAEPETTPPKQATKKKRKRKHRRRLSGPPKGVPDTVPEEADPASANPYEGDLDELFDADDGGGSPNANRLAINRKPARKAKPRVKPAPQPVLVAERENSSAPVALARTFPKYPARARDQHVEGTVVVRFVVDANGSVRRVKIIKGHPLLNAAVVAAVRAWRYEPGTYEGRPIAMWRSARFPFRLSS